MKDRIETLVSVVLGLCALVVTGMLVQRHFFPGEAAEHSFGLRESVPPTVAEWRDYAAEGHVRGSRDATVTIVAFSDFQCPACRIFAEYVPELLDTFGEDVAVVYRHFPMPSHPYAIPVARASECAAAQGGFERFHDAVYAWQDSLAAWPARRFAELAAVSDLDAFERCQGASAPVPALERDTLAGLRLAVTGTPTLLVNGRRLNGVPPLPVLKGHIREELRETANRDVAKAPPQRSPTR